MYRGLHVKYLLFLPDCNETLIFLRDIWTILKHQSLLKPIQCGSQVVPCGQTSMVKLMVAFGIVVNMPKKWTRIG
jgi:hypothetical protein